MIQSHAGRQLNNRELKQQRQRRKLEHLKTVGLISKNKGFTHALIHLGYFFDVLGKTTT